MFCYASVELQSSSDYRLPRFGRSREAMVRSSRTSSARRNEESHVAFHSSQDTSSYSQQCEREGFGDVTKTPLNTPSTG
ncbi:predicted protein [Sclerotinia sclerotiorum 1980 UF-70]|uniref:Uncharacterized protein n=1 Tax=Sclerotinia sclerotiorum (strain ATCC 18683 / 1980 / Ss-1) TaxID=665079 RepID=A7EGQ7_SCLS1|nr:predicted protein [Sclerotinia sclerotiorum 1980 UF-70]EDO02023.1 predicted protein [Sclerotinia sclerotiorum 1980 UF-70]